MFNFFFNFLLLIYRCTYRKQLFKRVPIFNDEAPDCLRDISERVINRKKQLHFLSKVCLFYQYKPALIRQMTISLPFAFCSRTHNKIQTYDSDFWFSHKRFCKILIVADIFGYFLIHIDTALDRHSIKDLVAFIKEFAWSVIKMYDLRYSVWNCNWYTSLDHIKAYAFLFFLL